MGTNIFRDGNNRVVELQGENRRLTSENAELKRENEQLKRTLNVLKTYPTLTRGMTGEALVATTDGSICTGYGASCDIQNIISGARFEVKSSGVRRWKDGTKRWIWSNSLGGKRRKDYEFLILLGDNEAPVDPANPDDLYVFFLVPKSRLHEISTGRKGMISLSMPPARVMKKGQVLWSFKVLWAEIQRQAVLK